ELLLQKFRRQRGVRFGQGVDAAQQQQVVGALERAFERAICLVDARRRLKRKPPLFVAGRGKAVRVNLRLQLAVRRIELRRVEAIARRQAEQREVVLGKIDHGVGRPASREGRRGVRGGSNKGRSPAHRKANVYMLKLSPQPHSSFTFGLL